MNYYIKVTYTDLTESLEKESISPSAVRNGHKFGSALHFEESDNIKYIILSKEDMGGDYTIVIDSYLLDEDYIVKVEGHNDQFILYTKTIYFRLGYTKIRFEDNKSYNFFESVLSHGKGLKSLKKFQYYFYKDSIKERQIPEINVGCLKEKEVDIDKQITLDNAYNKVKGAIMAYICDYENEGFIYSFIKRVDNLKKQMLEKVQIKMECGDWLTLFNEICICSNKFVRIFRKEPKYFDEICSLGSEYFSIDYQQKNQDQIKDFQNKIIYLLKVYFNSIQLFIDESNRGLRRLNFSKLKIYDKKNILLDFNGCSTAENDYINVLLKLILTEYVKDKSEESINKLIVENVRLFKEFPSSKTPKGVEIIKVLRRYWKHRFDKSKPFDAPYSTFPLLSTVLLFYENPYDLNQGYNLFYMPGSEHNVDIRFASFLSGAFTGYANMSMQDCHFYNYHEDSHEVEDYLFQILYHMEDETSYSYETKLDNELFSDYDYLYNITYPYEGKVDLFSEYLYVDKFVEGFARVKILSSDGSIYWGVVNKKGKETTRRADYVECFTGSGPTKKLLIKDTKYDFIINGNKPRLNKIWLLSDICPVKISDDIEDSNWVDDYGEHYGEYEGSYAQDYMGYSDEIIDDAFEGDPDAYWNID